MTLNQSQEQQHPQDKKDRAIIDILLKETSTDFNLAELARLRIRYRNFPGARDIQKDLDAILTRWQLNEEELYTKTRQIHQQGRAYQRRQAEDQQDWS